MYSKACTPTTYYPPMSPPGPGVQKGNREVRRESSRSLSLTRGVSLKQDCNIHRGFRPLEIKQPEVSLDETGNFMEVKWSDDKNPKDTIEHYEIQYDSENGVITQSPDTFSIKVGPPKVKLGDLYTVQVRGRNAAGPGNWSEPAFFRFTATNKPTVRVVSPEIGGTLLQKDENRRISITHSKVVELER